MGNSDAKARRQAQRLMEEQQMIGPNQTAYSPQQSPLLPQQTLAGNNCLMPVGYPSSPFGMQPQTNFLTPNSMQIIPNPFASSVQPPQYSDQVNWPMSQMNQMPLGQPQFAFPPQFFEQQQQQLQPFGGFQPVLQQPFGGFQPMLQPPQQQQTCGVITPCVQTPQTRSLDYSWAGTPFAATNKAPKVKVYNYPPQQGPTPRTPHHHHHHHQSSQPTTQQQQSQQTVQQ